MIISVLNQKGGVGKTTTTLNLGAALAATGTGVFLADLDLQRDLVAYESTLNEVSAQPARKHQYASLAGTQHTDTRKEPMKLDQMFAAPEDESELSGRSCWWTWRRFRPLSSRASTLI